MSGLCSFCCDFGDVSGFNPQVWIVYIVPWRVELQAFIVAQIWFVALKTLLWSESAPLFTHPILPISPQQLFLLLFSQWRKWMQTPTCLASLGFGGISENSQDFADSPLQLLGQQGPGQEPSLVGLLYFTPQFCFLSWLTVFEIYCAGYGSFLI